jgi:hypothetical protein
MSCAGPSTRVRVDEALVPRGPGQGVTHPLVLDIGWVPFVCGRHGCVRFGWHEVRREVWGGQCSHHPLDPDINGLGVGCSILSVLASADVCGASPVCAWAFVPSCCLLGE